ncbi:unnamed protein product [Schistosoma margrebowiei]|uniref:Uncharacterized protein n=1 Tax=Schistosoma margrebowiei TaxID=48269 RepID=A0A3P8D6S8_9TREM|nr:unnamed protein product [Schistosoma margrebowiei]
MDSGFVLLDIRQQGVPVILSELVLPNEFALVSPSSTFKDTNHKMVVGGSQLETLDSGFVLLGTRQQGVPVILSELVLPDEFDLVSPSFTDRDVTTELSGAHSQLETLDLGFVLLGTRQQGVPAILSELVLPDGFDPVSPILTVMVVGGSQLETLDSGFVLLGTRQQGVPVILRELVLPDEFDLVSFSFTVRDVTTERSGSRASSCRTEMYLQLIDHWVVINVMCVNSFLVQIECYRPSRNVDTGLGDSIVQW